MKHHSSLLGPVALLSALLASACSSSPQDLGSTPASGAAERTAMQGSDVTCDPSPVADPPFGTVEDLTALVVARWVRCDGPPQLEGEDVGVQLTEGRVIWPLARGDEGDVVQVPPVPGVGPESWSALDDTSGRPRLVFLWAASPSKTRSSFVIDGPFFFDGGKQMFLPYSQVGATYVRLEP